MLPSGAKTLTGNGQKENDDGVTKHNVLKSISSLFFQPTAVQEHLVPTDCWKDPAKNQLPRLTLMPLLTNEARDPVFGAKRPRTSRSTLEDMCASAVCGQPSFSRDATHSRRLNGRGLPQSDDVMFGCATSVPSARTNIHLFDGVFLPVFPVVRWLPVPFVARKLRT